MKIPGLYASVTSDAKPGTYDVDYWSACGIAQIAFQEIEHGSVVTPYASFPVIMANETIGLAWYLNMIQGPAMQNLFGSTESTNVNGKSISPVITWDSKITTIVAMLSNHLIDVSRAILKAEQTYDRFHNITEVECTRVFGLEPLLGENLPWLLPSTAIPHSSETLPDFTKCSISTSSSMGGVRQPRVFPVLSLFISWLICTFI